jgi:myosin heavy subunit
LYVELANQFVSLGFTNEEQLAIWKVTAACLHLGEIVFDESTYNENGKPCSVKNMDKMNLIADLLGFKAP